MTTSMKATEAELIRNKEIGEKNPFMRNLTKALRNKILTGVRIAEVEKQEEQLKAPEAF